MTSWRVRPSSSLILRVPNVEINIPVRQCSTLNRGVILTVRVKLESRDSGEASPETPRTHSDSFYSNTSRTKTKQTKKTFRCSLKTSHQVCFRKVKMSRVLEPLLPSGGGVGVELGEGVDDGEGEEGWGVEVPP